METKIVGNKIVAARKKMNISQAHLAERLFLSPQAIGKWERGESTPDIITLNKLAEILGVDLNYFSEGKNSIIADTIPHEIPAQKPSGIPAGKKNRLSWDMSRGNWIDADFSGLTNLHEKFSTSNMKNCKFIRSEMSGLILNNNNIENCDFSGSDLSNSQIRHSNLVNNLFRDCSLKETEFSETYIYGCDFTGADFTGLVIRSGSFSGVAAQSDNLSKNTITHAVWNRSTFIDTDISDVVFTGKLEGCYFENCAFTRVLFRDATLTNTFFKNKTLRRIRFIGSKADRMTYEFLKNGKADLTGITLLPE